VIEERDIVRQRHAAEVVVPAIASPDIEKITRHLVLPTSCDVGPPRCGYKRSHPERESLASAIVATPKRKTRNYIRVTGLPVITPLKSERLKTSQSYGATQRSEQRIKSWTRIVSAESPEI
jgi:hypothetical protein